MIIWINGCFGVGKTETSIELNKRIEKSFIYDPENIGSFIRENIYEVIKRNDFQDYEIWREMNLSMIKYINKNYDGTLIIPMTLVNPIYFNEIIGSLRKSKIDVRHFTLMAKKETLVGRLKKRGEVENSWAERQIDRCQEALNENLFDKYIYTDDLTIEEVVDIILKDTSLA